MELHRPNTYRARVPWHALRFRADPGIVCRAGPEIMVEQHVSGRLRAIFPISGSLGAQGMCQPGQG